MGMLLLSAMMYENIVATLRSVLVDMLIHYFHGNKDLNADMFVA